MVKAAKSFGYKNKTGSGSLKPRANAYQRGYGGAKWEHRRKRVFLRDNYICRMCGGFVINEKNKQTDENKELWAECDHIVPLSKGGPDTDENCQTLHKSCHSKKTRREEQRGG